MMKITVIAVGKIKERYFCDAIREYQKRLGKYCKLELLEVTDEKTPDGASVELENQIKEREGERIRKLLKESTHVIALAIDGRTHDSVQFSKHIERLGVDGYSHLTFLIGGSLGLADSLQKVANEKIGFSAMTFPHQLMRVILLEQIYRGFRIINHEPYHK